MAIIEPALILASGSRYRRELLNRLTDAFSVASPDIDESPAATETPAHLAARLARAKADAVAAQHPEAVVIGSDQVAALGEQALGKPGNRANAAAQLAACSGSAVVFYTAVCVICKKNGLLDTHTDITTVRFRTLQSAEIDAYLQLDEPWDCAGSFKSEAHGSLLFTAIDNQDPSAIIGLPLIWLGAALRSAGVRLL